VELRQLRYFVAVADHLNFTRAAARLYISTPALSMQVRQLEKEIGAALLSREGRGIKLTEAGRAFLGKARETLANASTAITLAQRTANGEIGQLTIGYHAPAEIRVFPKIVPAARRSWPNLHLSFHDLRPPQQLEGLRRDELDLGVVWLPVPTGEFEIQELTRERLVAVLPVSHRLSSASTVSVKDLSGEPMVLFPEAMDLETFHEIEQLFSSAGAAMNIVHELETLLSIISFVAMGLGCSVLPAYMRSIRYDGIVYRPLRPPNLVKTLAIIKKKGKAGLSDAFYRLAVKNMRSEITNSRDYIMS
jgi:DNA-binding transcriptional LysR family regulator